MNIDITALLPALREGDDEARNQVIAAMYEAIHSVAGGQIFAERAENTLSATELVNECFLRLFAGRQMPELANRRHLLAIAARVMRQVLIDAARRRNAQWRRQLGERVELEGLNVALPVDEQPEALGRALDVLERIDPKQAQIVELRFFVGLSQEETADVAGVSVRTVQREWRLAKAWLLREMNRDNDPPVV